MTYIYKFIDSLGANSLIYNIMFLTVLQIEYDLYFFPVKSSHSVEEYSFSQTTLEQVKENI